MNNFKAKKEKSIQKNINEATLNSTFKIQNINTNNVINQNSKIAIKRKEKNSHISKIINKPNEIKNLAPLSHLKKNIKNYEKNCHDSITNFSFYCFSCNQSVCHKCGLNTHKEHILVQRNDSLNYNENFFREISKVIENSLLIEDQKNDIKNKIANSINELKNNLDNLKINKFKEIDDIFVKLKNNLLELKNNYLKTKKNIENYYSTNKNFFNLCIENINNIGLNKDIFNNIEIYYNKDNLNNNSKSNLSNELLLLKNKDIENTIFIMNFDLMNNCDNQNLKVLDFINNIKKNINIYLDEIDKKTFLMQKNIFHCLDIPLDIGIIEDFYKEINSKVSKFSEHISLFKETVNEIIKKTSNYEKIKDLINILESKNNKGKKQIFEQDFFKSADFKKINVNVKKRQISNKKLKRAKSGNFKFILRNCHRQSIKLDDNNISFSIVKTNILKRDSSKNNKRSISPFKTLGNKPKNINNEKKMQKSISFQGTNNKMNYKSLNTKDIILNQRILQKFFAYTTYGFYLKNSSVDLLKNKENIKKMKEKINNIYYKNLFEFKNIKNEDDIIIKTASYLENYTQRYNKFKEQAKPIIGTNQIQLYDLITKKITKKTVNLNKEVHGYIFFPEGCRHILLNDNLFITGGTDMYGMPINIVLEYNLQNNHISKLNNLVDNHSYHSLEYIEKYDSIILIGGENSSICEIMDVDMKKWYKLPSLNYPRANANIYFNFITNNLFILFGISGDISEKKMKYSDIIEVIEMDNISNGWTKIDYYKTAGLNLKNKYCMTLPFTKDKLLIYGAENMRSENKNLFSLFDLNKNECIKVDMNTLDQIKLEEKKIRLFDLALDKLKFEN